MIGRDVEGNENGLTEARNLSEGTEGKLRYTSLRIDGVTVQIGKCQTIQLTCSAENHYAYLRSAVEVGLFKPTVRCLS